MKFVGWTRRNLRNLLLMAAIGGILFLFSQSIKSSTYTRISAYISSNMSYSAANTNSSTKIAVFLLFDSIKFKANAGGVEAIVKWPVVNAALRDCSVLPSLTCRVYLLFYKDDTLFTEKFQNEILTRFRTLTVEDSSASESHRANTDFEAITLSDSKQSARLLNDVFKNVYLKNFQYFYLILSLPEDMIKERASRKSVDVLREALFHFKQLSEVGIALQTIGGQKEIVGVMVSQVHLEIFGEMFPHEIQTLSPAVDYLVNVYPENLILRYADGVLTSSTDPVSVGLKSSKKVNTSELMTQGTRTLERYLKVLRAQGCIRCNTKQSKNVIAMSLYGRSHRYTMGALRNAQLLPIIFPNWCLWFYCERASSNGKTKYGDVPSEIVSKLEELGAEIRYIDPAATGLAPMLWRFTVAEDPKVDVFIVRDCDSRLTSRDSSVVSEWLKTNKAFHCIRDHPSHSNYAVSGGLWGGRRALLDDIFRGNLTAAMKQYGSGYVQDMHFLGKVVWPMVKDDRAYCHDSFSCQKYQSSHPFPVEREGYEHLGQVYDEHSIGRQGDMNILKKAQVNKNCIPS